MSEREVYDPFDKIPDNTIRISHGDVLAAFQTSPEIGGYMQEALRSPYRTDALADGFDVLRIIYEQRYLPTLGDDEALLNAHAPHLRFLELAALGNLKTHEITQTLVDEELIRIYSQGKEVRAQLIEQLKAVIDSPAEPMSAQEIRDWQNARFEQLFTDANAELLVRGLVPLLKLPQEQRGALTNHFSAAYDADAPKPSTRGFMAVQQAASAVGANLQILDPVIRNSRFPLVEYLSRMPTDDQRLRYVEKAEGVLYDLLRRAVLRMNVDPDKLHAAVREQLEQEKKMQRQEASN